MVKKAMLVLFTLCMGISDLLARGNGDTTETRRSQRMQEKLESADTRVGTFSLVDNQYPALVDTNGETWYLVPGFPMDDADIPAEGDSLVVRSVPTRFSPVHIRVLEVIINGELYEPDWSRKNMRRFRGRRGMHRSMHKDQDTSDN